MAESTRGFFAVGIHHPKREVNVGSLWRAGHLYGAAFVFTVGRRYTRQAGDTTKAWRHIPLLHFADVADLREHMPYDCPLIGVELDERSVSLSDYRHPERAVYLLGAEDHGLPPSVLSECHDIVQVESPVPWSMNVAQAGAIVLRDRYLNLRGEAVG